MSDPVFDVAVVGGGPAGLICAITAMTGLPINPPRHFSGIVIEKHRIGQFARYGKLRITHKWHFSGRKLIEFLEAEARGSRLQLLEHEEVSDVSLEESPMVVRTSQRSILARKVALCTGFFPHADLLDLGTLVRPVFSPAEIEAPHLPAPGLPVAILGRGDSPHRLAEQLRRLRPEREFVVLGQPPSPDESRSRWSRILVDYNSYTLQTQVTDFLGSSAVQRRNGYIVADANGNTGIPGVVAAGNIVTPVSGVLTALHTGFLAGLNLHVQLFRERFGHEPLLFPWLPTDGSAAHPLRSS